MAERVIATGPIPGGSRSAQVGAALGRGLGVGLGGIVGQNIAERRAAKQLNPFREALLGAIPQGVQLTPQQQMIAAAVQDPRAFARLAQSPQGALELGGMLQPQAATPAYQREFVVRHDSELNQRFGLNLGPGDTATIKLSYDANDNQLPGFEIEHFSRASEGDEDFPFGGSRLGRSDSHIVNLAEGYARGTLTPEQERIFETAVKNVTAPYRYTDPDTGLLVERRGELPDYAIRALQMRGKVAQDGVILSLAGDPVHLARQPSPEAEQQHNALAASLRTIPTDAMPEAKALENDTIYEIIASGDVMGPGARSARFLHQIPLVGELVPGQEETEAGREVAGISERIVKGLQQNPRFAEGEAARILKNIRGIEPSAFRSTSGALSELIGVDRILARIEAEMQEVVTGRRALVSGETRQHAMDTLQFVRHWRGVLVPPRVKPESIQEFARTAVPGQKVIVEYAASDREVAFVFNDEQRAAQFAQTAPVGTVIYVNGQRFIVEAD